MSEPITFRAITVEAFRGFRDRKDIPLDASAVIVAGPNGTGKTSLFDAFQWLLLGRIGRLETLRLRQTDEFIVNQYRLPGPAVVEAHLLVQGQVVRLRRSGDSRSSLLEWESPEGTVLRGADADRALEEALAPSPTITLAAALTTAALLQQDLMRSVIEAKASDRFRYLNELLGLEVLEQFEQAVRTRAKEAAEATDAARLEEERVRSDRQAAESRLESIRVHAAGRPSVEAVRADLEAVLEEHRTVISVKPAALAAPDGIRQIAAEAKLTQTRLSDFLSEWKALQRDRKAVEPVDEAELERARRGLTVAQSRLASRARELSKAKKAHEEAEARANELARLAALAVPLLGPECPVCLQPIDPDHVAAQLQARASDTGDLLALGDAVERAAVLEREAEDEAARAQQVISRIEDRVEQAADISRREQQVISDFQALIQSLRWISLSELSELASIDDVRVDNAIDALAKTAQASERLSLTIEAGSLGDEESRLRAEIESLVEAEQIRRRRIEELALRQSETKQLLDATIAARVAVVKRRVDSLRPLVADIYSRLDPHPSFKQLDLEHDVFRAKGTTVTIARDLIEGREVNPALVFSSAQANIAALSYFLALGWAAGPAALPFLLLDDPLQSMDDVNVLGFSDLCRFVRADRQLFVSTHELRFANLLERKLAPRSEHESTLIVNFLSWDRSGPDVDITRVPPQLSEVTAQLVAA